MTAKKDEHGFIIEGIGGDDILLTVIGCDGCEDTLGTCRQIKFIEGKKIRYVLCDSCGIKTDHELERLKAEVKLLKQQLEKKDEAKYDGG